MKFLKKYLLDILVVIVFAVVSFVYFMPADMDGRILFRHDAAAGKGLGHEKELFQQQTGEVTRWTNSVLVECQLIRCHHLMRVVLFCSRLSMPIIFGCLIMYGMFCIPLRILYPVESL